MDLSLKAVEDYDKLYYAASSRAIGDWVLGMNATRLYTLKYGRENQVLSMGGATQPGNGGQSFFGNRKLRSQTILGVTNDL